MISTKTFRGAIFIFGLVFVLYLAGFVGTASAQSVPAVPSNLTAVIASSGTAVSLSWTDNSVDESEFHIFRMPQGGTWAVLAMVGTGITTYGDLAVPVGTYEYMVAACNIHGCSAGSNIATATIAPTTANLPVSPSNLTAVIASSGTDVGLSWTDNSADESDFKIYRRLEGGTYSFLTSVGSNTTTYSDLSLAAAAYEYYIVACHASGCSMTSNSVFVTIGSGGGGTTVSGGTTHTGTAITSAGSGGSAIDSAELKGKVIDAFGVAVVGAFVSVHTTDGSISRGSQTDSNGQYSVFNIPSGAYLVDVSPPQGATNLLSPPPFEASFSAGQILTKDFSFIRAVKIIKGKIAREDGRVVTNAYINAFQSSANRWTRVLVDNTGVYALFVSGGSWEIMIEPSSPSVDWSHSSRPKSAAFADDAAAEEKIVDFTVVSVDSDIRGKILLPDDTPPAPNTVFISFRSSSGAEFGAQADTAGLFRARLVAGTYSIFISSQDPTLKAPASVAISVASGETKDLGIIKLTARQDHIQGAITDQSGQGIANVEVSAWQPEGRDYARTKTDSGGSFNLFVSPGEWEVNAVPDSQTSLYNPEPPKRVSVIAGAVTTVNLTLYQADSRMSGTLVDKNGNVLSDVYGFAGLSQDVEFGGPGIGGPIERGQFLLKAPAGVYRLNIFLSPDSAYTAGEGKTITLTSGQTISVSVAVFKNASTIIGALKDEGGKVITGFDAHIFASSKTGVWQQALFNKSTGQYTLKISAGTWYLGYEIDSSSVFISRQRTDIQIIIGEGETLTKDLIVQKAGAIIKGRVTDPEGLGAANAFVGASKTSFGKVIESQEFKDPIVAGSQTDSNGFYSVSIPAGSYFVKTFTHPERGFINPSEETLTIADGETKVLDLKLRRAELKITGKVLLTDSAVAGAFVWGWSKQGGYQESFSKIDGSFQLNVTANDTWVISAATEQNGVFYKANEVALSVEDKDVAQDIHLEKFTKLPSSASETRPASQPTVLEVKDGPTIVAPANSVSTSGSISITATPDTRVPSQGEIKVVGLAYNLEAKDDRGQVVSNFQANITISLPYNESDIARLGVVEDNLAISLWDETVGTWRPLDASVVNKDERIVTAVTDHFTRFAIVAAADITPPEPSTQIKADALGKGKIKLTWKNPVKDFSHAKIYRSSDKGQLGKIIASEAKAEELIDSEDTTDGVTYYYTIRSVDPAGNESGNKNQVAVNALGTATKKEAEEEKEIRGFLRLTIGSAGQDVKKLQQFLIDEGVYPEKLVTGYFGPLTKRALDRFQEKNQLKVPKAAISRNLVFGSRGDDVKIVQQLFVDEGVYPEAMVTGYFGALTKQAAILFQEKYREEILAPVNLDAGTGFIGPSTRKKITEILGR